VAHGNVGMVGLGIMGSAISANLIAAGWDVTGYDIDAARMEQLQANGGTPAESVAAVAQVESGVVLTSLPSVKAFEAVIAELAATGRDGLVVAELSTMPLEVKEAARERLAAAAGTLLDCPLSGTGAQAVTRDLSVYASGDAAAIDRCRPVFDGFANFTFPVGEFGAGTRMKFVANLLVAVHNLATAEAFVLGMKAGLDPQAILDVVSKGAGNSRVFELRGPMMVANSYDDSTMKFEVFRKDVAVISEFAAQIDCPTPLLAASLPFYAAALAQGRDTQDTAALCAVLEDMAGLQR
jgi:L-threonate 2-dehydrogenase